MIISADVEFTESDYYRWTVEERKVTGLFFDDNDDDGDDSNIEDENNDPTLSPSPNKQNPA